MFDNAKYIVVDRTIGGYTMIIFPGFLTHEYLAKKIADNDKVISAGFINSSLECYGKSVSLGIESKEEMDTLLAKSMFNVD